MAKVIHGENCGCLKTYTAQMEHHQKIKLDLGSKGLDEFFPHKEDRFPVTKSEIMQAVELVKFHQNAYKLEKPDFQKMRESDPRMQSMAEGLPVILRVSLILEALGLHELERDFTVHIAGAHSELMANKRVSYLGPKKSKEQGKTKTGCIPNLRDDLLNILKNEGCSEKLSFNDVVNRLGRLGYDSDEEYLIHDIEDIKLSTLKKDISVVRSLIKNK
jgi:hypothetical protein